MTVPFPNGALEPFLDIAFGADVNGDQSLWTWVDITPTGAGNALMAQEITTTRGRQDEAGDITPTQADMQLDNPNGDFTPFNPMGAYWPNVTLGTPARWGVRNFTPRLESAPFDGSRAQVASTAALNITTDLDVRIDLHAKTSSTTNIRTIIAGRGDQTTGFSWDIEHTNSKHVIVSWSTDGVGILLLGSDVPVLPTSARAILRVTLDVDNGAGGHEAKFYLGQTITGPWMQIGATQLGAGTTSIFNAAKPLVVGLPENTFHDVALDADVYRFQLRDGIDGTIIADANFETQTSDVTTFVDTAGRTWTIEGNSELTNKWCRILGTVDEWNPTWPWGDLSAQQDGGIGVGEARVDIVINGVLRRLGQRDAPLNSTLHRQIEREALVQAYWPMEDDSDSTQIASALPDGLPILVGGEITFASNTTLPGSKPLPRLSNTTFFSGAISGTFSSQWQVDWFMNLNLDSIDPGTWSIQRITGSGTVRSWEIRVTSATIAVVGFNSSGGVVVNNSVGIADFFDRWMHFRLSARQTGPNVEWILVWSQVTFPLSPEFTLTNTFVGSVGVPTATGITPGTGLAEGSIGHTAVYDAYDIDFSGRSATGWISERALERIIRLCNEEGVSLRIFGSTESTPQMGPQSVDTFLGILAECSDVDAGILYEQQCGLGLIYRTRTSLYNQPYNMTLSGLTQQIQNSFNPILDDQKIRNIVTVARKNGSSSTVTDQASVDQVGIYDESLTLNFYLDSQTLDAAAWRLHQGTIEGMRYPQITTNLGVAPEIIDPWLTVDVASRVEVIDLPPQHPTDPVRVMVEGYSEPIAPTDWVPVVNCSPAAVWDVAELDGDWVDDEFLLRLDTDGSQLASPIDSIVTSFPVELIAGPHWVTGASEFPFDINVGGERMTVSAIGAPAGGPKFGSAGNFDDTAPTVSFVAPSVIAPAALDLLVCLWSSSVVTGTYVMPGGMSSQALTSGTLSSVEDATEAVAGSGPTGTRTATFSTADRYSAMSIMIHGVGTPTITEHLSGVAPNGELTLTTSGVIPVGSWVLALQAWNEDPGNNMRKPLGDGWVNIADSMLAVTGVSRVQAWAKPVKVAAIQEITFQHTTGVADNHGRVYVLSGVADTTQTFTVTRSVNNVVKSHPVWTDVRLWFKPVLAR